MALQINDYANGGADDNAELHDINVTPFIDVMLVSTDYFYGGGTSGHRGHPR